GAVRDQVADHRIADQREVPDGVEDLVAHELVLEPERVVQHARLAEDDRIVERAAEREPALTEHLDFLQEPERPRRRDFLDERLVGDLHRPRLVADERVVEADAVGDLEVVRRIQRDPLVALAQRDRPQHLQILFRRRQFSDARLVEDEVHERRGAAVHDRHLGTVELDNDVVDAERRESSQQVLHGLDRHGFTRQAGRELNAAQMRDGCGGFQAAQIGALKTNTVVSRRGLERERDLVAGMKTDAGTGHGTTEGSLRVQVTSLLGPGKPPPVEQSGCQQGSGPAQTDKAFYVCYLQAWNHKGCGLAITILGPGSHTAWSRKRGEFTTPGFTPP